MDRCYLSELFGGRVFPDGTFAIDYIDEILEHQKVFMEVVSEIRNEMMYTFPVLTYSLLYQNGKFVDEEFARWCCKHNMNWYDSNFYVGEDVTSLSNCCFDARQSVTIRVGGNVYEGPFKKIYQTFHHRKDVEVYFDGKWQAAKLTALEEKHPIYEVKTENGRVMYATEDHIHLTTEGELKTYQLKVDQYLKIETNPVEKILTSELGKDKIIEINRVDQEGDWVFCVEVEDKDNPYFCLTNGIQTHNCRLISDTSKLDAFINSIGGTSLSIGSIKVSTINLRRIALESGNDEDRYLEILKDRIDIDVKILDCVRHTIMRNIEKGLLPNYTHKLIDIEKQYNTIGITAMFETLNEFGYIGIDDFGNHYYTEDGMRFAKRIMNQINTQKEEYDFKYSINVECIPKMSGDKVA